MAQTGTPAPAFEVASVKPFPPVRPGQMVVAFSDAPASRFEISGTRITVRGNLMSLVAGAYEVERFRVTQGPDWTDKWATSEVFEIEARAPGDAVPSLSRVRPMMQTLLAERFQLKTSRQSTTMPVYHLVVAPGGPQLTASEFTDHPPLTRDEGSVSNHLRTRFLNYSMADFANTVQHQLDRPLLDQTGLNGGFDFSLAYTWQRPGMSGAAAEALGISDLEPGQPIVASIREQLGLRVVPAQDRVEILVIAHAEKPSAN
ncbi:MAG TPA: TIGR03435 family protein [Bryobacteraceae bacterium]|jgi:uncharacterized protein (TIGR03435 family)|nr:TIGR03435 family protein [Bryobacteraceae bacterium]